MAANELIDVVDEAGNPVDTVTRGEMRAKNLRHRSVGIVIRSVDGSAVLAHQRAAWKDVWPSRWDLAVGGVCGAGEDWVDTAVREVAEEAGVGIDPDALRPIGESLFENDDVRVFGKLYELRHDGPFTHPDGEVVATEWVPLADLDGWVADHLLCDDTAAMVLPYLRAEGRDA